MKKREEIYSLKKKREKKYSVEKKEREKREEIYIKKGILKCQKKEKR